MTPKPTQTRTVVEATAEHIAFQIASGVYPPGSRLPSVRDLAVEYRINPSTAQVVLAWLQSSGFVEPRKGVGFLVRDVALSGGIETWRYVFRFAQRLPERAIRLLEQIFATRLLLIAAALEGLDGRSAAALPELRRAVARLELSFSAGGRGRVAAAQAELQATRLALAAGGHEVLLAIFNSIAQILLDVPAVLAATYAEPSSHLEFWRALLNAWERGTWSARERTRLAAMLRKFDAEAIDRFRKLVG